MALFRSNKNIFSLTEDLLVRVREKLATESDRKSFRLVCREFHRIDLLTRKHLRVLRIEFLPSLLQKHPQLQSLDLSACPRIDDRVVSFLLTRVGPGSNSPGWANWTRGLKCLVLSRTTGLRFTGLEMLARACPCLKSVDVSYCCGFGDREAAALSCAVGLRELKMDKCLHLSDVGLAKIAVGCLKLEKLSLKWCMDITDLGVDLLCKKCLDLKYLDVSYLKVTNESLHSIASLLKLEVLGLVACPLIDDAGLQFIGHGCPLLKVIDVSRCEGVSSSGLISVVRGHSNLLELNAGYCLSVSNFLAACFLCLADVLNSQDHISGLRLQYNLLFQLVVAAECGFLSQELSTALLHWIKNLKHLEMIRIDGARISESSFPVISTNCKSLIEIGLSKCVGVTNMGIMRLVSGCINLRVLNLTCCHSITDAAISAIADSCRNLVCLKLESCHMITEKGLCQLGSSCLLLEEIDLTDCCGVNDKGLEYLSRCSQLLCLKLGLCTNISGKGLSYIGSNCTKIHELDLYRCSGIGDDGLDALSRGCKKLAKLNLSYCKEVSDRGLGYIGHLEELSDLEMRGLFKITGVGLEAVAAGCKRLADLDLKHCDKVDDSGYWALAYYSRNLRQINLSYCGISDIALCMVMGNLTRLQEAKLVHLGNVTVEGFELALRACCIRIKKVKLLAPLRLLLSSEILETLHARGCIIRWD
ncbi:Leucine-rich repeat - like 10 [Theobroma cacao]|nr:Leucine-rich repeat - like 10 [Theobroma cacao]